MNSQYKKGVLDLCVLSLLQKRDCYGYEISDFLSQHIDIADGTYILLDGAVVRKLLPQSAWTVALPIYYIVVVLLVLLTIRGFFRRNRRQYQRFAAQCA